MIIGIKYVAPRGSSGYSEAAKDYMIALHNQNIPVSWHQLIFDETEHQRGERNKTVNFLINNKIDCNKVILHSTPEWWPNLIKQYKKEGIEIIGYTVWETDRLDDRWIEWVNMVDKVIVPCTWNKEVFINCGITKPIEVIPHIYKSLPEKECEIKGINKNDFVFYTIGQWSERKGIDDTIKAYLETFVEEDEVCLVVRTFRNDHSEEQKQLIRNYINSIVNKYTNPAKVVLLLNELSDDQIAALHRRGNCYVSLCKSEGWGLGAFDAVGIGNPVVMTGFGGQCDFMFRYKVPYKLIPVEGMGWIPWYNNSQRWAQPNIPDAVKRLRQVYESYKEMKVMAKQDARNIETKFNSEVVINKMINFLDNDR